MTQPNQYQIQQFDPFGKSSQFLSTFAKIELNRKANTVGTGQIVLPAVPLVGVGYEVLENINYSIDWTNYKNMVFVGGAGNGEDRLIVQVADTNAIGKSKWGRAEVFEASRDSADVDALAEVGRNILGSKREIVTFSGELQNQPNSIYGANFFFGDVLSFSQPNITATFNTPFIIQKLNNRGLGITNDTIYFLKSITVDNSNLTTTLLLNDALSLLNQRIVGYALDTPQTTKELPADDLIKEICRENLLADGREVPNFSVDGNLSLAPSIKVDDIAWRSVLSVCQEICQASFENGVPLYFDIVADINLGMRLKTFVGQRGADRAGIVGIDSPFRGMINAESLVISDGREDRQIEFLQLNGEELATKPQSLTITSNEATVTARSGRSGGVDPFEYNLIDSDGELLADSDGELLLDSDAP